MRILSFTKGKEPSFGIATDGGVVDVGARLGGGLDLVEALASDRLAEIERFANAAADYGLDDIDYLPVIASPGAKFICIGINYRPHMREMGREPPAFPVVFVRFPNSLVGHQQPLQMPQASEKFDFEGELAVVIGKPAHRVDRKHAMDHIAGFTCFNDGSVRDFQRHSGQFTPGKNFLASGAIGPWLVTANAISDPAGLQLTTRLNGNVVQQENTGELIFDIGSLIEYISTWTELMPGDVIATGTPGGVGAGRNPPLWMRPGDTIEVEISEIGVLRNRVE